MIFRKILRCVQDDFKERFGEEDYEACVDYDIFEGTLPEAGVPSFLDIVWADDLAVIVTHKKADVMLERLTYVTSRVFFHCVRHGLAPNLRRGKTEVLLFLRGPGSRNLREQYFNVEEPYLEIADAPPNLQKVAISASYKHLGSRIHLGKGILPELKARLGAAMAIFRKHRRTIFQNSLLTLHRRKYLFTTMVLSIIRYNSGTWGTLSSGETKYFTSRVMSMYRGLLRATHPDTILRFWNNSMVLSEVGLASPLQLLTEARLSYVISVCKSGPPLLWSLAAAEKDWICSVREDKEWPHTQLKGEGPDRFGALWAPDYTKEIVDRPNVFKRWIRKASKHAILQHRLNCQWREWHHDFLLQLIDSGYSSLGPRGSNWRSEQPQMLVCFATGYLSIEQHGRSMHSNVMTASMTRDNLFMEAVVKSVWKSLLLRRGFKGISTTRRVARYSYDEMGSSLSRRQESTAATNVLLWISQCRSFVPKGHIDNGTFPMLRSGIQEFWTMWKKISWIGPTKRRRFPDGGWGLQKCTAEEMVLYSRTLQDLQALPRRDAAPMGRSKGGREPSV